MKTPTTVGTTRETWSGWTTKAIWQWNGRMWIKIGDRRVSNHWASFTKRHWQ